MYDIVCQSCKVTFEATPEFAGKSVVCPTCRQAVTVPTSLPLPAVTAVTTPELAEASQQARTPWRAKDGDYDHAEADGDARSIVKVDPIAWVRIGVYAVIGLSVLAVIVCLLLPAVQKVGDGSARTHCVFNLKNIGLAIHGFHDAHKRLPFNGSDTAVGNIKYSTAARAGDPNSGSWAFQILPYIDQTPMFSPAGRIHGELIPPDNRARQTGVMAYMCPGRGRVAVEAGGGAWTDYFLNNHVNDPLQARKPNAPDKRRTFPSITDGMSNTIFVGQGTISTAQYAQEKDVAFCSNIFVGGTTGTMRAGDNGKRSPTGVTLQRDSLALPTVGSWGGPFPQGALMGLGDATVRMFPYSTNNFSAFLTPDGDEAVTLPDT